MDKGIRLERSTAARKRRQSVKKVLQRRAEAELAKLHRMKKQLKKLAKKGKVL